jgi:hypothetical protein
MMQRSQAVEGHEQQQRQALQHGTQQQRWRRADAVADGPETGG